MKYIGLQNDLIAFVANTREELENDPTIEIDRIEERDFAEMFAGTIYTDATEFIAAKNAHVSKVRETLYVSQIDPLHAEKQRKVVLGTWTEEMEAEYVAKVQELTAQIQTENPYIETVD